MGLENRAEIIGLANFANITSKPQLVLSLCYSSQKGAHTEVNPSRLKIQRN